MNDDRWSELGAFLGAVFILSGLYCVYHGVRYFIAVRHWIGKDKP